MSKLSLWAGRPAPTMNVAITDNDGALAAARTRAAARAAEAVKGQVVWLAGVWRRQADEALAVGANECRLRHGCDRESWAEMAAQLVVESLRREGLNAERRGLLVSFVGFGS